MDITPPDSYDFEKIKASLVEKMEESRRRRVEIRVMTFYKFGST